MGIYETGRMSVVALILPFLDSTLIVRDRIIQAKRYMAFWQVCGYSAVDEYVQIVMRDPLVQEWLQASELGQEVVVSSEVGVH